jgi:hypothetical protein
MRVHRIGIPRIVGLVRIRAGWFCVCASLGCAALVVGTGSLQGQAQSEPPPAAVNSSSPANAPAPVPEQQAKQQTYDAADKRKRQISEDCANLLKLANGLKAEVDKTTKDTLSMTVVRRAGEVEQLAHKMKDEMKPVVGKN